MTIQEAIKFIVNRNDESLLKDSKKFKAYLGDLCSENPKELKIINRALEDKILEKIFGNDRDNVKIAKLRDEFEDQGMSEIWSEFIISSFAQVLGWNYEPKEISNIPQQITYKEVTLDKIILEQLGYEVKTGDTYDGANILTITKNGNEITSINIPATYIYNGQYYKITSIGNDVFNCCLSLKSVQIPDTIKEIGTNAFQLCESLENINIPKGVYKIGGYAFNKCRKLKEINIPDTVKEIGEAGFQYCESLESIEIPYGVNIIEQWTFSTCKSLKNITIPESVTTLKGACFALCNSIKNITLPSSIKNIYWRVFNGCTSLEKIEIPYGITSIGEHAFEDCKSLESVEIPSSITEIGEYAFGNCKFLEDINLPYGLTKIGDNAFENCRALENLEIPYTVQNIGSYAFSNCKYLDSIEIPENVYSIGYNAFLGLKNIKYEGSASGSPWGAENNNSAIEVSLDNSIILQLCNLGIISKYEEEITIPETYTYNGQKYKITTIGTELDPKFATIFEISNFLKSSGIDIEDNLDEDKFFKLMFFCNKNGYSLSDFQELNEEDLERMREKNTIFKDFSYLEKINLPNSIKKIQPFSFCNNTSLKEINIPESCIEIGLGAFMMCTSLEEIKIPHNVTTIGSISFASCSSLSNVTFLTSENEEYISGGLYLGTTSIKEIGESAFGECNSISDIHIPSSVTSIGNNAFEDINTVYYDGEADDSPWGAENHFKNTWEAINKIQEQWSSLSSLFD